MEEEQIQRIVNKHIGLDDQQEPDFHNTTAYANFQNRFELILIFRCYSIVSWIGKSDYD